MDDTESPPPKSAWQQSVLPLVAAVVTGLVTGMLAALPQSAGTFLVGLQSLAAGAMLSLMLVGSVAILSAGFPRWPMAVLASLVAVVTQHYWLYRAAIDHRQQAVAKQPAVELFRPGWSEQSFWQYFANEASRSSVALWALDAVLLTLAAVVIVEYSARQRHRSSEAP